MVGLVLEVGELMKIDVKKHNARVAIALLAMSLMSFGFSSRGFAGTSSSLLAAQQTILHTAVTRDQPKSATALRGSISDLQTKILGNDSLLKKCASLSCSFDLGNSKKTGKSLSVYMVGDSHTAMWIPAVYSALRTSNVHLVARWGPCGPIADVALWGQNGATYGEACPGWRSKMMALAIASKPDYVVLTERTSTLYTAPNVRLTEGVLQSGLERTIRQFTSRGIGVIVIGDFPPFAGWQNPASCVSVNLKSLSHCFTTISNPYPEFQNLSAAERAASLSTNATFIDTTPWLCDLVSQRCPAVVNDLIMYRDWSHISLSAAYRLAPLMAASLKPALNLK